MKKEQEEARGKKERGDIWKSKKGNRSSCKRKRERKKREGYRQKPIGRECDREATEKINA